MADEQRVSQGGITVPSELVEQTEQVSQGGITVVACVDIGAVSDLAAAVDGDDIVLTWTIDDTEDSFVISRSTDGINYTNIAIRSAGTVIYTDENVTVDTLTYYKVVSTSGLCEGTSSAVSALVPGVITEPCPAVAVYQLWLYDVDGNLLAIIDDYRSLQYGHVVNDIGFFTLQMSYNNPKRTLFEENCILVIKRKIPGYVDWYIEFVGIVGDDGSAFFGNGNTQHNIVGKGLNVWLKNVVVGYASESSYSKKDDAAESAMKAYVLENRGAQALTSNGREADADLTGFYVDVDLAQGITWTGERSGKTVLSVLQDIALFSLIDFNVITHPALGVGNYLFKTYEDQLGTDRTNIGLDTTTGLNASGNSPHIFSLARGNIANARISTKNSVEINRVFVFGRDAVTGLGVIEVRETATRIDPDHRQLKEAMRGGSSQGTTSEMEDLGDEYLAAAPVLKTFDFIPFDSPASLYGVHYFVGDRVTANLGGIEYNKRLTKASITVSGSGGGESNKTFEFSDIPG